MSLEQWQTLDLRDQFAAYNPYLGFWVHDKVKVIYPLLLFLGMRF